MQNNNQNNQNKENEAPTTRLAEYIWLDGNSETPQLRSKTRIIDMEKAPPVWSFDGSSTNQAETNNSDCVLMPVLTARDPFRGYDSVLLFCEVWNTDDTVHATNTREACRDTEDKFKNNEPWIGFEQEYTLMKNGKPLGFPENGEPNPQGDYYCGNGNNRAFGRQIAEDHLAACLYAGIGISGLNAEVCPGQWEYQVGPLPPTLGADQVWLSRYIMERVAERANVEVSWDGKPIDGDWNGAGCHANFSTKQMRESYIAVEDACEALERNANIHIQNYGHGIERRLTGEHETCNYKEFKWGVSDRGASVRIPWHVAKQQAGYIEDRRPNANCDPYKVAALMTATICSNYNEGSNE